MKNESDRHHSLWDLAVLCFLRERPMHPYEMQRLLLERHWDEVLVLKRGSLYHAISRLLASQLITATGVSRAGRRPERTTYQIAEEGRRELVRWLQQMVAVPVREPSTFMAAMNFLIHLAPGDAIVQLEHRSQRREQEITATENLMKQVAVHVPRLHLLEAEYQLSMRRSELEWVRALLADLRSGQLNWDLQQIFQEIQVAANAQLPTQPGPKAKTTKTTTTTKTKPKARPKTRPKTRPKARPKARPKTKPETKPQRG
jgi:DNA-binding PadR family transcriptional regulator